MSYRVKSIKVSWKEPMKEESIKSREVPGGRVLVRNSGEVNEGIRKKNLSSNP